MPARLHCPGPLRQGDILRLAAGAARHVQVLRLQPGDPVVLFDGRGGEWRSTVHRMGRSEVDVLVGQHAATEREAGRVVHLALGIPANDRMDWLVEKAAELGAASIQPLQTERSVVRLAADRAERKREHWQAVAIAACEQCGGNLVPAVHAAQDLSRWAPPAGPLCLVLSLDPAAQPLLQAAAGDAPVLLLSGAEGGLSAREESDARRTGFAPVTLGLRVLRAETAPLAALAALTLTARGAPP